MWSTDRHIDSNEAHISSWLDMVEGRRIKFLDKLLVCDGATVIVQTYE